MGLSKEEKKKMKSERVKLVFAETARSMIHKDGIEEVSVRKIADQAGYSLGTVYNHFQNLDALLWMTRDLMLRDLAKELDKRTPETVSQETLVFAIIQYAQYYMSRPNVFKFFFFHHLSEEDKLATTIVDEDTHQEQVKKTVGLITQLRECNFEEGVLLYRAIIYMVHGMLMMLISDNDGVSSETLEEDISASITLILSR